MREHVVVRFALHSLVWVLIAAGCFLRPAWATSPLGRPARHPVYVIIFLVYVVQDRRKGAARARSAPAPVRATQAHRSKGRQP